jgi:parallel beta-helix repeat protein
LTHSDVDQSGGGDYLTIQEGIDAAAPDDTVLVACGTYNEHDIVVRSGVYLKSETGYADCVTIDACDQGGVMSCVGEGDPIRIEGFTITGGRSPQYGGGLYCDSARVTLARCNIIGNSAGFGGGAYLHACTLPVLRECNFVDNSADGIAAGVYLANCSSALVEGCTVSENLPSGVLCNWCDGAQFTDCDFSDNLGSGLELGYSNATLTGCTFKGNKGMSGGGISCFECLMSLRHCDFSNNEATTDGGAIDCDACYDSNIEGCTFSNNRADAGGGIRIHWGSTPTIRGCTFSGNTAPSASGIKSSLYSSPRVENTIVAFGGTGPAVSCYEGSNATMFCCNVYGNAGGDWIDCIADQYGLNGNTSLDPCFCEDSYMLGEPSPCAPDNSPEGCGLIGALRVGCAECRYPVPVEPTSWGHVKSLFR